MQQLILEEVLSEDVETIKPLASPGVVKASAEEAAAFFGSFMEDPVTEPAIPDVVPRPVAFEISKISRDGEISIDFNQKMKVPGFAHRA
jgi:hypothetical protein